MLQREKIDRFISLENMLYIFSVHTEHRAGLTTCRFEGRGGEDEEGAVMKDQLNSFT